MRLEGAVYQQAGEFRTSEQPREVPGGLDELGQTRVELAQ